MPVRFLNGSVNNRVGLKQVGSGAGLPGSMPVRFINGSGHDLTGLKRIGSGAVLPGQRRSGFISVRVMNGLF